MTTAPNFYQSMQGGGMPSTAGQSAAPFQVISRLNEIQTAQVGRKYGLKDRRPLDPPPVVQLQIYQGFANNSYEIQDYESVDTSDFICYAELFSFQDALAATSGDAYQPTSLSSEIFVGSTCVEAKNIHYEGQTILVTCLRSLPGISLFGTSLSSGSAFRLKSHGSYKFLNMNMDNRWGFPARVVLGYCWGNHFRVYPSRSAPILESSTELTKALAEAGIPVTIRENKRERKRKANTDDEG
ncbi:hypothetical protein C8F01DRAFT_1264932 [Mycena amicta]|nr:hypothetical protein C8F01DRAFT_1264932 [Mycena amicta]